MSKEKLTVVYKISGDESSSNALTIVVATAKEVILLDILAALPSDVGYNYSFWARRNASLDSYMLLKSPSSILPVIGSVVYLYLEVSGNSPYVPLGQTLVFTENSRSQLYSRESYFSAAKQANAQSSSGNHNRFRSIGQQRIRMNSKEQERTPERQPSKSQSSYRDDNKKQSSSPNLNTTAKKDRRSYEDTVTDADSYEYDYTYSQNQDKERENNRLSSNKKSGVKSNKGSHNSHADDLDLIAAQAFQATQAAAQAGTL